MDGLDQAHLAWSRTQVLEASDKLDESIEEGHSRVSANTGVLAEAEGADDVVILLAVRIKLGGGRPDFSLVAACFALVWLLALASSIYLVRWDEKKGQLTSIKTTTLPF